MTTILLHTELHARPQPALGHLLPKMESGLVDVHDLCVGVLLDHRAQLLHELQLLALEIPVLGLALPVSVVRPFELDPIPQIVVL